MDIVHCGISVENRSKMPDHAVQMGPKMSIKWFAAQVQPRQEALACLHLGRQDFVHYSPRIARTKCRSRRVLEVREPLFPGYVFGALDLERDRWRSVNSTMGVSRLVMFGEQPAGLPEGFVDDLIARSDAHQVVSFDTPLAAGDAVRIVGGAFDDLTGTLLTADRNARVIVLIELLSGPRRVDVPRARLIAA